MENTMEDAITVYGTDTCEDTIRTLRHFAQLGASYRYVNVAEDSQAARRVRDWNQGKLRTPTVVFSGEQNVLAVPSDSLLDAELDRRGLFPLSSEGDGSPGLAQSLPTTAGTPGGS